MSSECLNCAAPVQQNYCANCGQKSSTHRYSIAHFISHDFVHGVWHVDKGILFTLKELFTRPGHSVREYIEGKRINYFSFVTMILMILTLSGLLAPFSHVTMADLLPNQSRQLATDLEKFMTKYPKLVLIVAIPVYALFSQLWFRKAKLNFSEHLVLNAYRIIPELVIGLILTLITIFYTNTKILTPVYFITQALFGFIYSIWVYNQFFSKSRYSKKSLLFRSIMIPVSYMLLSFSIGMLLGFIKLIHK